jgi:deoxyribonuclease V
MPAAAPMKPPRHSWRVTPAEAREIQLRLRPLLSTRAARRVVRRIAGVDVGFEQAGRIARAAVVVLSFPDLEPIEQAVARRKTRFPYVPGLLSFRECPAALAALQRLENKPDVLLCDGQGYAHPRRFGFACHLGVLSDTASIGVAKSRLIGTYAEPGEAKGSWVPLLDGEEVIGAVVRSRSGVKPLYVSIGHKMTLPRAVDLVLAACTRYRLPETTRAAHRLASESGAAATRKRTEFG